MYLRDSISIEARGHRVGRGRVFRKDEDGAVNSDSADDRRHDRQDHKDEKLQLAIERHSRVGRC